MGIIGIIYEYIVEVVYVYSWWFIKVFVGIVFFFKFV